MKKITTGLTALVMLFATSAFAADTKPSSSKEKEAAKVVTRVKTAFQKQFSDVSDVTWELKSGFYFADFKMNGKTASAAYTEDGDLVGTLHRLDYNQLPQDVQASVKQKYDGYEHGLEAEELTYDGVTSYFFTISNGKETLNLKSSNAGDFSVVDRSVK
jgi:hypothetical protein